MPEGLIYALAAGLAAREMVGREKPGVLPSVVAGLLGTVVGAWLLHRLGGSHQFHAFQPESFVAGLVAALLLLIAYRLLRARIRPQSRRIFY